MRIFDNFNSGFIYGFIAAGIIGLFLDLIREARGKMGQQHRTLDTFSDSEQPKLTAAKIVRSSELGTLGCIFWTLFLIAMSYGLWLVGVAIRDFSI